MSSRPPSPGITLRRRAARLFLASFAASSCAALSPQEAPAPTVRGPLPTRVQHPLALTLPNLTPRRALVQATGTWGVGADLTYSSIFESASAGADRVSFDAEILRVAARARWGFAPRFDLELELAGAWGSGGFLDAFLEHFHDLIGAPNQGRENAPRDRFESTLRRGATTAYGGTSERALLGDTLVVLTFGPRELAPGEWGNAWRVGVDLPTGDESAGAGSGGVDWIVGWMGEGSYGRASHFGGASYGRAQTPAGFERAGLELASRSSLFYGLEWRWSDRVSWVLQLDAQSPLVTDIALDEIDRPILDFGVGVWRDLGGASRVWFSFHEDLLADSGPDFALTLGWTWGR